MGTSLASVHVYSTDSLFLNDYPFQSFSPGWQTCLLEEEDMSDPEVTQKLARKISRSVDAPVLWFYIFDSEFLCIKFYLHGRQVSCYSGNEGSRNINLFQIPQLIGYDGGTKRRLSKILSCSDVDLQVDLLEEYLGLCLLPFPQPAAEDTHTLFRMRDDKLFKAYAAEEKKLTGKRAVVRAEPVQELEGLLYNLDFDHEWFDFPGLLHFKPHYYLHFEVHWNDAVGIPVHFHDGKIRFISREEMKRHGADKPYPHSYIGDNPHYTQAFFPDKLIFLDTAPDAYRGKEFLLPRGFGGLGFDSKGRLVIYDSKNTFAVIDESMKLIAKQRLKGQILDIDGDYILTLEHRGATGTIRIYRIFDKQSAPQI